MNTSSLTYNPAQLRMAKFAKALSHPARIKILHHLASISGCCAGDFASVVPEMAQSTLSQHLKELRRVQLIEGIAEAPRIRYRLNKKVYEEIKTLFGQLP